MNNNPLISIVIPVYNGSNYLAEAIDSALSQTYENIEILVVNDGSRDDGATEKLALSYGDRIRYIPKESGGVSSALNRGIREMKGEYLSWLSHDDRYYPNKIADQVALLREYKEGNLIVFTESDQIDANSCPIKNVGRKKVEIPMGRVIKWDEALSLLIRRGSMYGCNLLLPKSVFERCGLFDETLRYSQDYLMWMKMFLNQYDLVYSPTVGTSIRIHGGQLTQRGRDIYRQDIRVVGDKVITDMERLGSKTFNFLHLFAVDNAVLGNAELVKICLNKDRFSSSLEKMKVMLMLYYGINVRPFARRVYYRVFKNTKTK